MVTNIGRLTMNFRAAIEAWKEAQDEACAAEDLLAEMLLFHVDRRGPPVSDALVKEVADVRSRAHRRLTLALALVNSWGAGSPSLPHTLSNSVH